MVVAKISSLFLALGLYFWLFVFGPWYAHLPAQGILLAILIITHLARLGWCSTRQALGFVLPFVLSLLIFGALFQWLGFLGRTDWIMDSVIKTLVFPNSFFAVKLILQAITFGDILLLPLPQKIKFPCIILKAVLEKGSPLLQRYYFFMNISPHFRDWRFAKLRCLAGLIVAAYVGLYRETEKIQILLTHRISTLRIDP